MGLDWIIIHLSNFFLFDVCIYTYTRVYNVYIILYVCNTYVYIIIYVWMSCEGISIEQVPFLNPFYYLSHWFT